MLLLENSKIIHSLRLKFGVLESWHCQKTQLLSIYAVLTYIFITFLRNACHIYVFCENSLAYVNVLRECLLAPLSGCWGSSDEGSYSLSLCLLVDLCFCSNSVLRSHLPCPSRLLHSGPMVILQSPYLCSLHICSPKA